MDLGTDWLTIGLSSYLSNWAHSTQIGCRSHERANARSVSTSILSYGGITYFINSFDYPNLLCFNSLPTQHQLTLEIIPTIQIGSAVSSKERIVCGVPQGSVLGRLLFLIYVNMCRASQKLNLYLFADDTNWPYVHVE